MIKSVRLTNFFSFRDCEITLEPDVTVLVGINGSGKTNLLRAFELLKAGIEGKLREKIVEWGGASVMLNKSRQGDAGNSSFMLSFTFSAEKLAKLGYGGKLDLTYEIQLDLIKNTYVLSEWLGSSALEIIYMGVDDKGMIWASSDGISSDAIGAGNELPKRASVQYPEYDEDELALHAILTGRTYKPIAATRRSIRALFTYSDFDTRPRSQMRQSIQATGLDVLDSDGSNLFQILNTIQLKSTEAGDAIEKDLKEVNPNFDRLQFQPLGQGGMLTYLREVGLKTPIPAAHVSDGTLRYLCLLAIAHNPDRGRLICLDEPERGLHPDMLAGVARLLLNDGHANPEAPRHTSYVVATHSPQLLSRFPLRCLRIFEKDENNQTIVRQFGDDEIARFREWYDTFDAGSLWLKGELGGTRW